ncbi:hypothetical protein IPJ63_00855 [Candidatus Nomurabacteria bacterium]|nr:MAG: hypothetical protein IPJ63_00855 [Candidatus Nomurabacteria bacterium]
MRILVILFSCVAYIAAFVFIMALMTLVIESAYGTPLSILGEVTVFAGAFVFAIPSTITFAVMLGAIAKGIEEN